MNVGHVTLCILLKLSNYWASKADKNPTLLVATDLIEVYGDISIRQPGSNLAAR